MISAPISRRPSPEPRRRSPVRRPRPVMGATAAKMLAVPHRLYSSSTRASFPGLAAIGTRVCSSSCLAAFVEAHLPPRRIVGSVVDVERARARGLARHRGLGCEPGSEPRASRLGVARSERRAVRRGVRSIRVCCVRGHRSEARRRGRAISERDREVVLITRHELPKVAQGGVSLRGGGRGRRACARDRDHAVA